MPTSSITCPDCGLVVTVVADGTGTKFVYAFNNWQRLCKRLDLDGPVWCCHLRDGCSPKIEIGKASTIVDGTD